MKAIIYARKIFKIKIITYFFIKNCATYRELLFFYISALAAIVLMLILFVFSLKTNFVSACPAFLFCVKNIQVAS